MKAPDCNGPFCCFVYRCPTSGEWESSSHGGFDTCCDDPACPSMWGQVSGHRLVSPVLFVHRVLHAVLRILVRSPR